MTCGRSNTHWFRLRRVSRPTKDGRGETEQAGWRTDGEWRTAATERVGSGGGDATVHRWDCSHRRAPWFAVFTRSDTNSPPATVIRYHSNLSPCRRSSATSAPAPNYRVVRRRWRCTRNSDDYNNIVLITYVWSRVHCTSWICCPLRTFTIQTRVVRILLRRNTRVCVRVVWVRGGGGLLLFLLCNIFISSFQTDYATNTVPSSHQQPLSELISIQTT